MGLKKLAQFHAPTHNEMATVSWMYVQPLPGIIGSFSGNVKLKVLKEKLHDIHPVDLADILEELDQPAAHGAFSTSSNPSTRPTRWRKSSRGCSANSSAR